MHDVQTVQVNSGDPLFAYCSDICKSANKLYNAALYLERQVYFGVGKKLETLKDNQREVFKSIEENLDTMNATVRAKDDSDGPKYKMPTPGRPFLNYEFLRAYMQVTNNSDYIDKNLTRDTAKNVLREVSGACMSYLKALRSYQQNREKFTGKPKMPGYLEKEGLHTASLSTKDCVLTTLEQLKKSEDDLMRKASCGTEHRDAMSIKHESKVVYFYHTELCCDIGDPVGPDGFRRVTEVKIVPCQGCFKICVHLIDDPNKHSASERALIKAEEEAARAALVERCNEVPLRACSIDLGVENFAAITNNVGAPSILIKGGFIKSFNQYFNKKIAELRSKQDKERNEERQVVLPDKTTETVQSKEPRENIVQDCGKTETGQSATGPSTKKPKRIRKPDNSNLPIGDQIQHLCTYRDNKMENWFHQQADGLISWCKALDIHVIVVGKNAGWKQNLYIGKVNNQKFAFIPYNKFISKMRYRAERENIYLLECEESYTSQASFIDKDSIPTYKKGDTTVHQFSGVRGPTVNAAGMKKPAKANGTGGPRYRGLYMSKEGKIINADLNGSANIGRKALPQMFKDGQEPDFENVVVIRNPDNIKKDLLESIKQFTDKKAPD